MTAEARAFQQFLDKANDTERNHLRLEVEKLRRAEGDWLQVLDPRPGTTFMPFDIRRRFDRVNQG